MSRTLLDGSTYIEHRQIILYLLLSFIPITKYKIVQRIPVENKRERERRMIRLSKRERRRKYARRREELEK
jgi:hypothetical protein